MKIIEISSKDNEKIKILKKLGLKKYRNKFGKFVVENLATLYDGLKGGSQPETLFLTKEAFENKSSKMKLILERIDLESVFIINENINKYFSNLDTPSGVAAVYGKPKAAKLDLEKDVVYLNGIKDPGNMGTILRSALSFGIKNIVVDELCVDPYNPKVVQASKDAIFKLNVVFDKERDIIGGIKKKMKVLITDVSGGDNITTVLAGEKNICVVLGSESYGVDESLKELADKIVNIKSNSEMESLNVAVSAGIIFHEMYNRK